MYFSCSVSCCRKHRENKCEVLLQKTANSIKDEEELVVKRRKIETMDSFISEDKFEQLSKS